MKKTNWRLQFQSVRGNNYTVNILSDDTFTSVVELTGAKSPLDTQEDESSNIFEPVRSQSGTLHIINDNILDVNSLQAANNTEKLVQVVNDSTGVIEWQGFVSCESYSQEYISRPHSLDISLNSVLRAMDSVQVTFNDMPVCGELLKHVIAVLKKMEDKAGVSLFDNIYISEQNYDLLITKLVYGYLFIDTRDIVDGDKTDTIEDGNTCSEVLSKICAFSSITAREHKRDIYLLGSDYKCTSLYRISWSNALAFLNSGSFTVSGTATVQEKDMDSLFWVSDTHDTEVKNGARLVSVSANLKEIDLGMTLSDAPVTECTESQIEILKNNGQEFLHCFPSALTDFSNLKSFKFHTVHTGGSTTLSNNNTWQQMYNECSLKPGTNHSWPNWQTEEYNKVVGACMARIGVQEPNETIYDVDMESGLYISGFTNWAAVSLKDNSHVFEMRSRMPFAAADGYFKIDVSAIQLSATTDTGGLPAMRNADGDFELALVFGGKYWDGQTWRDDFHSFTASLSNGKFNQYHTPDMACGNREGLYIPIPDLMYGYVYLRLYHYVGGTSVAEKETGLSLYWEDYFIKSLSVEYVEAKDLEHVDRQTNQYSRKIDNSFPDEQEISLDIASYVYNKWSPSLLLQDEKTPEMYCEVVHDDGGYTTRPERELLNNMYDYYSKTRRNIRLNVDKDASIANPVLLIKGYDNKIYAPLSFSRNWANDTGTITLFETDKI